MEPFAPTPWGTPVARLGRGALSDVYLLASEAAHQPHTAVKVMRKAIIVFLHATQGVVQETAALAAACAPPESPTYIARMLGVAQDQDHLYLRLEAVLATTNIAKTVRDLLHVFPEGLEPHAAACVTFCLSSALEHLHSRSIAHRDVKPENVALGASGEAKLLDFGAAKCLSAGERTDTFCGTTAYMAPEVFTRRGHSCSVDAWSLGIVVLELLSGHTLHSGATAAELHTDRSLVRDAVLEVAHVEDGAALVEGLLQIEPHERLSAQAASRHPWLQVCDWGVLQSSVAALPVGGGCMLHTEEEAEDRAWAEAEREEWMERAEAAWVGTHGRESTLFASFGAPPMDGNRNVTE